MFLVPISDRFLWVEVPQVAIGMGDLGVGFQRVSGLAHIHGGLVPPMLFNTLSAVWFSAGLGNLCLNLNPEVQKIISAKFGKKKL